jgi:hypothetical protein
MGAGVFAKNFLDMQMETAAEDSRFSKALSDVIRAVSAPDVEVKVSFDTYGELILADRVLFGELKFKSKRVSFNPLGVNFELKNGSLLMLRIKS